MLFADIPGYDELKNRLRQAVIRGQIGHALLFSGTEGTPVVPLSLAFIRFLFCVDRQPEDSCGKCHACSMLNALAHPDVTLVYPVTKRGEGDKEDPSYDLLVKEWRTFIKAQLFGTVADWAAHYGAGNRQPGFPVDDIRKLNAQLSLKSYEGGYKVAYLWAPEFMRVEGANAFLKTLEEPSAGTVIVMATTDSDVLLPTILSRVQYVRVRPFEVEEAETYLRQQPGLAESAIVTAARSSEGNMRQALEMLQADDEDLNAFFFEWMRHCYQNDAAKIIAKADVFGKMGRERQKVALGHALALLRQAIRLHMGLPAEGLGSGPTLERFAQTISAEQIETMTQHLERAIFLIERNINSKLLFVNTSIAFADKVLKRRPVAA